MEFLNLLCVCLFINVKGKSVQNVTVEAIFTKWSCGYETK